MLVAPINNVLVKIKTKWHKNISNILLTAEFNPANQLNPADCVNITGEIVSLPITISDRMDYKGFTTKDMQVGDTAIFRYDVVYDLTHEVRDEFKYKNCFWYKGEEYWKVDVQKIFGVVRGSQIIMVNGYCMVEDCPPPSNLYLPQTAKQYTNTAAATLTQIGKNLDHLNPIEAIPGDKVYFNWKFLQRYEMNKKPFGIITQKRIFGKKVAGYEDFMLLN